MPRTTRVQVGSISAVGDRDDLVLGVDQPDASNTGVPAGTSLTSQTSGAITQGATYTEIDFRYQVVLPSGTSRIFFDRCKFSGPATPFPSADGLIKAYNAAHAPATFTDCTFLAQAPGGNTNGLHGYGYYLKRCDVSYVVDENSVFNTNAPDADLNVQIEQSYFHDLWWVSQAEEPTFPFDGAHNDDVQLQGGANFSCRGNTIEGFNAPECGLNYYGTTHTNANFMIKPDVGLITGLVIEDNWLSGGPVIFNFAHDAPDRMLGTVGRVWRNKIIRGSTRLAPVYILRPSDSTIDFGGTGANANRFTDDNSVVPVNNG